MQRQQLRVIGIATFALTLLTLQNVAWAGDLVAIVDLKFIRATDQPAMIMCLGDRDEDCVVWATLNLYKARIRKVISGTESRKTMFVTFGRHALMEKDLRGVIATMNKREAKEPSDPQYQIVEWGYEREMVCFRRRKDDTAGFELKEEGEEPLTCYDKEPRD
jgi:hypothetical protein